jgi:diaminopimelate epimerase
VKNGLTDRTVTVSMPGGELDIEIREDWSIKMRGAVEEVAYGTLSDDLIGRIKSLGAD